VQTRIGEPDFEIRAGGGIAFPDCPDFIGKEHHASPARTWDGPRIADGGRELPAVNLARVSARL
jgi:hypothetical protein